MKVIASVIHVSCRQVDCTVDIYSPYGYVNDKY